MFHIHTKGNKINIKTKKKSFKCFNVGLPLSLLLLCSPHNSNVRDVAVIQGNYVLLHLLVILICFEKLNYVLYYFSNLIYNCHDQEKFTYNQQR